MASPTLSGSCMTWSLLEGVLKHIHEFWELYLAEGTEELVLENGFIVNIYDMKDVLGGIQDLPDRQREAVTLICINGLKEVEAASIMLPGSKWSSPIGAYKRTGLQKLVDRFFDGSES